MPDLSYDLVADLHPDREEVDVKGSVFYSAWCLLLHGTITITQLSWETFKMFFKLNYLLSWMKLALVFLLSQAKWSFDKSYIKPIQILYRILLQILCILYKHFFHKQKFFTPKSIFNPKKFSYEFFSSPKKYFTPFFFSD
jgi:hypothetical protein